MEMISWQPVYNLAIIKANSLASVPEFVMKTTLKKCIIFVNIVNNPAVAK